MSSSSIPASNNNHMNHNTYNNININDNSNTNHYVLSVDVGTGSIRSALINTSNGIILSKQIQSIDIYNPQSNHYEQDIEQIWKTVISTIKEVIHEVSSKDALEHDRDDIISYIQSICFTATASIVTTDSNDLPLS